MLNQKLKYKATNKVKTQQHPFHVLGFIKTFITMFINNLTISLKKSYSKNILLNDKKDYYIKEVRILSNIGDKHKVDSNLLMNYLNTESNLTYKPTAATWVWHYINCFQPNVLPFNIKLPENYKKLNFDFNFQEHNLEFGYVVKPLFILLLTVYLVLIQLFIINILVFFIFYYGLYAFLFAPALIFLMLITTEIFLDTINFFLFNPKLKRTHQLGLYVILLIILDYQFLSNSVCLTNTALNLENTWWFLVIILISMNLLLFTIFIVSSYLELQSKKYNISDYTFLISLSLLYINVWELLNYNGFIFCVTTFLAFIFLFASILLYAYELLEYNKILKKLSITFLYSASLVSCFLSFLSILLLLCLFTTLNEPILCLYSCVKIANNTSTVLPSLFENLPYANIIQFNRLSLHICFAVIVSAISLLYALKFLNLLRVSSFELMEVIMFLYSNGLLALIISRWLSLLVIVLNKTEPILANDINIESSNYFYKENLLACTIESHAKSCSCDSAIVMNSLPLALTNNVVFEYAELVEEKSPSYVSKTGEVTLKPYKHYTHEYGPVRNSKGHLLFSYRSTSHNVLMRTEFARTCVRNSVGAVAISVLNAHDSISQTQSDLATKPMRGMKQVVCMPIVSCPTKPVPTVHVEPVASIKQRACRTSCLTFAGYYPVTHPGTGQTTSLTAMWNGCEPCKRKHNKL